MSRPLTGKVIPAFGGAVMIEVDATSGIAPILIAEKVIQEVHHRLSRFESESELSLLNGDPRERVPASPLMIRFASEARGAAELTGGLVDATLLSQVEAAGYRSSFAGGIPKTVSVTEACSAERAAGGWSSLEVDAERGEVVREPGVRLDAGGIGKGLAADLVAEEMSKCSVPFFTVNCMGDLRVGGTLGEARQVSIGSPLGGGGPVAEIRVTDGAVATSGTTKRSWSAGEERLHHLIDPTTGKPAKTGVIQVSAVASTTTEAEARAKAALLSGPEAASDWLPAGGVVVLDDGTVEVMGQGVEAL